MSRTLLFALALALTPALAQAAPAAAPAKTPSFPPGVKDFTLAPAGTYKLDDQHTAVIAKVSHLGYSMSVFRFDKVSGSLTWDPATPAKSQVKASVATASITSPVPGFATELAGEKFLNAKAHPEATFVSTAFRVVDPTHGQVDGTFGLMGKTHPVTFDVSLVGAGPAFGRPRIGIQGKAMITPGDFGMSPMFADPIQIELDAEFERQP